MVKGQGQTAGLCKKYCLLNIYLLTPLIESCKIGKVDAMALD